MLNERRKNIVLPVVLLLGIFIGGVVVLRTQGIGAQVLTEGKKVLFPIASEPDADPDNDGLKNWEEGIYKTDPRNPDTDGDGYLDGEEVASGYDPVVKAPNDALEGADTNSPRPAPKNLTTYLAQILTQKISSGEISPAQGNSLDDVKNDPDLPYNKDLVNEALVQIGLRAKEYFALPVVRTEDISVSSSPTTYEAIGAYISAMGQAASRSQEVNQLNKSEVSIIKDAVESKDMAEMNLLRVSAQKNIENVKNITAPQGFESIHAQQIALLMLEEKIFDAVAHLDEDPAMAAAALETYQQLVTTYQAFSEELNLKIQSYQK
ncbi:MAG: thrombospondin type 3 repeat-containing protein [Candidatus Azambacteria bacterium]|nr:thrombospondin type 3 repeat-containing protein [Candidatus Azambacteria bacterium]